MNYNSDLNLKLVNEIARSRQLVHLTGKMKKQIFTDRAGKIKTRRFKLPI